MLTFTYSANQTVLTHFIIKGISDQPELQAPIFLLVLLIYLVTLTGNVTILLAVCLDRRLHTPMYFFLGNLSFLDMCSTTVTLHKVLLIFIAGDNRMSFLGCMVQMYFFASFIGHELLILMAMSYDRYVAVCHPLRYHTIMNHRLCVSLAAACWALGFLQVLGPFVIVSGFSCYTSNEINHFLCDILPLMEITCNDTALLEKVLFISGLFVVTLLPLVLTFISYVFIVVAIVKIRTSSGKRKAFYTCSSHLAVVVLLYAILICQYLTPASLQTVNSKKFFSLFNTSAVPMLNPLIYSFKNKHMLSAIRRKLCSKIIQ
ncbi:olfactory receptor 8D1-like [Spea bombifrons]|uniref:olfactory receptor 8D1-like n=1 Tax=Spea bombifrons TaxID=233779 RepID=UPI00234BF92F|nr:olfactory receptor 8D1-like [Spea bombifrons]